MFKRRKRLRFFKIVFAILIKPLTYVGYRGHEVNVPKDTRVVVDITSGIALVGQDHIDIFKDEYRIINN